ncbi:DUF4342 domain-containing protein [Patescibacteria group bacterium]|nr:DUF4342 domain-containing protein [Patescibacteria group bacterium]MBU4017278.1 DUF4342 domain-containing protein [Patescibacteria group bacterium]MBU4099561.1 DUF4342 domain-containing protein [Patescibacteria group bacterium]
MAEKKGKKKIKETFKAKGDHLLDNVKKLIKEGNVRRIIIKGKDGKTLVEIPLTVGVIGAVIAPVLAAVGAIAALVTECSITVERDQD